MIMKSEQVVNIIEALLFVSEKPLSVTRFVSLLPEFKDKEIEAAIDRLGQIYDDRSLSIIKIAGGYQLATKPDYHQWVQRLFTARAKPRLSQAALETLSVIAYKQPVSRIEIEAIRGVNSDGVLGTLLERNLVSIRGRAETVGRPLLYGTTDEFLHYFGLNDLVELPRPEEIEAMLKKNEGEIQEDEADEKAETMTQDET